ncbi:hypothetical protein, partial [Streptomyces nanshensis]|uniref:hypothetical protein n=1 Tax=Streptomyces nanshensis TaxID=518642 RepID=UPI00085C1A1D
MMAVLVLAGCPGAPGATTTMLALHAAWPLSAQRTLIGAECDPDGISLLPPAPIEPDGPPRGLGHLAVPGRRGAHALHEAFWRQLVFTDGASAPGRGPYGRRALLPGFTDPPVEAAQFARVWKVLAGEFAGIGAHGHDVLVDVGRSAAAGPGALLAQRADAVVLVARTTIPSMRAATVQLRALADRFGAQGLGLVLIEEQHRAEQVMGVLERAGLRVPLVGTLPYVPRQALSLASGREGGLERGELVKAARSVAERLAQQINYPAPVQAGPDAESGGARVRGGLRKLLARRRARTSAHAAADQRLPRPAVEARPQIEQQSPRAVPESGQAGGGRRVGSVRLLDRALRTLAGHCVQQRQRLPVLRGARVTAHTVQILPDASGPGPYPFTEWAPEGWWSLPPSAALLEEEPAARLAVPYPGLVTLGSGPEGDHLLAELHRLRALLLHGDGEQARSIARAVALEAATSPTCQGLEILTVGLGEDLPRLVPHARLRCLPSVRAAAGAIGEVLLAGHQQAPPSTPPAPQGVPGLLICSAHATAGDAAELADAL